MLPNTGRPPASGVSCRTSRQWTGRVSQTDTAVSIESEGKKKMVLKPHPYRLPGKSTMNCKAKMLFTRRLRLNLFSTPTTDLTTLSLANYVEPSPRCDNSATTEHTYLALPRAATKKYHMLFVSSGGLRNIPHQQQQQQPHFYNYWPFYTTQS